MGELGALDQGLDDPLCGDHWEAKLSGPLLLILWQTGITHHQHHAFVQHTVEVACQ